MKEFGGIDKRLEEISREVQNWSLGKKIRIDVSMRSLAKGKYGSKLAQRMLKDPGKYGSQIKTCELIAEDCLLFIKGLKSLGSDQVIFAVANFKKCYFVEKRNGKKGDNYHFRYFFEKILSLSLYAKCGIKNKHNPVPKHIRTAFKKKRKVFKIIGTDFDEEEKKRGMLYKKKGKYVTVKHRWFLEPESWSPFYDPVEMKSPSKRKRERNGYQSPNKKRKV